MADIQGFINRLTKNTRHWSKWARRQAVSCYRVYDRQMPDFPLAIDLYEGRPHVQEFESRWRGSAEERELWETQVRSAVAQVFELPEDEVFLKLRRQQKGLEQYQKTGETGQDFVVQESGLKFWVNLQAYLDTGLFLDHRKTRAMVRERAAGKRVLNLFAYTGSFSVYSAAGGAVSTTTVDLSNTYQEWTRRNFALNKADPKTNALVRADVFAYLDDAQARKERYELIVLDPPSFSNSKKMSDVLDVQRDHPRLINACLQLLTEGGELFFSNNKRGFELWNQELTPCQSTEITRKTLPEDFAKSQAHQCWLIQK